MYLEGRKRRKERGRDVEREEIKRKLYSWPGYAFSLPLRKIPTHAYEIENKKVTNHEA